MAKARGKFITFEGGEGAGKSTQSRLLAERLEAGGLSVVRTREPGGTEGADAIRKLLVEGAADRWDPKTELLLHYAARRDHVVRVIEPALARGQWVVCDRFADSTMAYQGYGHQLGRAVIEAVDAAVLGTMQTDMTIIMDLDPSVGLARAKARSPDPSRYERLDAGFHARMRAGFLEIAAKEPERCIVVDAASGPVDTVAAEIWKIAASRLAVPA